MHRSVVCCEFVRVTSSTWTSRRPNWLPCLPRKARFSYSKRTFPRCDASRDLTRSAETFVKYKEYIRNSEDEFSKETLTGMLEIINQYEGELDDESIDMNSVSPEDPEWQLDVLDLLSELTDAIKAAAAKTEKFIEADKPVKVSEFIYDVISTVRPRVKALVANISVIGNALGGGLFTFLLIWLCKTAVPESLDYLKFPSGNWGLSWVLWTTPLALATALTWFVNNSKDNKSMKALRIANKKIWFSNEMYLDQYSYGDFSLLIKSAERAWSSVVKYQGITFGIIQALWAGSVVSQDYAMRGFSMEGPVPPLLRLPVEILCLASIAGFVSALRDTSLVLSSEQIMKLKAPGFLFYSDPRIYVQTLEEFELLENPEITRDRLKSTFFYNFMTCGYLTTEALLTGSLYSSVCTLFISYFIMFKGMQRKDMNQH